MRTEHFGLGPSIEDLEQYHEEIRRYHNELGVFSLIYYKFNRPSSTPNVFDEIISKQYYTPIEINGTVMVNPSRDYLDSIGVFIDSADILIDIAYKYIEDNTIVFDSRDYFSFDGIDYEIVQKWKNSRDGEFAHLYKLIGIKKKTRIQESIQEDGITLIKTIGFLWNVN